MLSNEIHRNILANMADGVLTLDLSGRITTFNAAAARILGLDPHAAIGSLFAEVFFESAAFDAFNELVLRAIYDSETTHSEELELWQNGRRRDLVVTTTFLSDGRDVGKKFGVIVVFSDITERRRREEIKELFGKYVDPRIVARISDDFGELGLGRREIMSVAFCDLEGFSGLSETLAAEQLVAFVNSYLSTMSAPVAESGGITDKFIGDAIMAFWGPPFTEAETHASLACQVALAQRGRLDSLRAESRDRHGLPLAEDTVDIRMGIATGELVAGTVGSEKLRSYTVMGDIVNVAARLEAANKALGTRILVSEETRNKASAEFEFRELGMLEIRGRAQEERAFELLAAQGELDPARDHLRDDYEAGLAAFRAGDFPAAAAAFTRCVRSAPDDRAARSFLARLECDNGAAPVGDRTALTLS